MNNNVKSGKEKTNYGKCAKSLQPCPILYNYTDSCLPGYTVHAILQQQYWNRLPCPPPGDPPSPGIKPTSLTYPALAGRFFTTNSTWEVPRWS